MKYARTRRNFRFAPDEVTLEVTPAAASRGNDDGSLCYIGAMLAKCLAMAALTLALQQTTPAPDSRDAAESLAVTHEDPADPQPSPDLLQNTTGHAGQDAGGNLLAFWQSPVTSPSSPATPPNTVRPVNPAPDTGPAVTRQSPSLSAAPANAGRPAGLGAGQGGFPARQSPTRAPAASPSVQNPGNPAGPADCNGFPCDAQPQRLIVSNPAPAPAVWSYHDKILWAAYVVLACLGYAGIMMALSLMKKIERQTVAAETAAAAAHDSAQAALLNAQALIDAERPWLVVTVEPSSTVENGFTVTATNRGRSPAQVVAMAEQLRIAADETGLPAKPEYGNREPKPPLVPIILLQGESTALKSFSRADARELCESDEQFARIENWEEKIFFYGKVIYKDLVAPPVKQAHQTDWCSWYIHGRQRSGLVIGGPAGYNAHT
ncbi:MAG: hypothetical protein WBE76_26010 [Terracidiphilus sp.]